MKRKKLLAVFSTVALFGLGLAGLVSAGATTSAISGDTKGIYAQDLAKHDDGTLHAAAITKDLDTGALGTTVILKTDEKVLTAQTAETDTENLVRAKGDGTLEEQKSLGQTTGDHLILTAKETDTGQETEGAHTLILAKIDTATTAEF